MRLYGARKLRHTWRRLFVQLLVFALANPIRGSAMHLRSRPRWLRNETLLLALSARPKPSSFTPCKSVIVSAAASSMSAAAAEIRSLKAPVDYEEVIKKSRFIARCSPASSFAEAQSFLRSIADPKATHNCWAWRGQSGEERSSDDGEPGGTAGRPILAAIDGEGLVNVMVVVTRYYGGIKLGTGGLVRAYGGVARTCLRNGDVDVRLPTVKLRLIAPLTMAGALYQAVGKAEREGEEFTAEEMIVMVRAEAAAVDGIRVALQDATRGAGRVEVVP